MSTNRETVAENFKYKAFISYSHSDEKWASWLHKALESYRPPKGLVGRETPFGPVPERFAPVFRDREELATSNNLGDTLTEALRASACQVVICSPRAATSRWTNEEILAFKRLGKAHRIFALIVDGEPGASANAETADQESFPPALIYELGEDYELSDTRSEPIAADARPGKDPRNAAKLKLLAGMLGVGYDDLAQREAHRRHRRMIAITVAASFGMVVASGLAGYAIVQKNEADRQRVIAEEQAETASQTAQFMVDLFRVSDPGEARGNTITAREILDKGAERIETELIEQPEVQATLMDTIGSVYESLGLYPQAGELLEQALAKRLEELGEQHEDVAQTMAHLAEVLSLQAEYQDAEPMYRAALETQRVLLGNKAPAVADTLIGLADLMTMDGRYEEAEPLFRESLAIRRAVHGEKHLNVAKSLEFVGMNHYDQGRYTEAEALLREAITMQRAVLDGAAHPDLADSLNNLALILWDVNELDEGEKLYREALAMKRKLYDGPHPTVATSLNNLGLILHDKGDYAGAEEQFRNLIEMSRQMLGEEHPDVASAMTNLSFLFYDKGDRAAAIDLAQQALEMSRRIFPEGHPSIANSLTIVSRWLIDEGEYAAAEGMLLESIEMQQELLGEAHPDVGITMTELARLLLHSERYQDAATSASEARQMLAEGLSLDHWRTGWAGVVQGAALAKLDEFEAAEPLLVNGLALIEASPSAGALRIEATKQYLQALYGASGGTAGAGNSMLSPND